LTPYLKKEGTATASKSNDNDDSSKSPNKKAKINLIFLEVEFDESSEENHKYYKHYRTLNILIRLFKVI
jgi:hypothetical protein